MSQENIGVLITFGLYLVLLVTIGRIGAKKHAKSYRDFVNADKSLSALVTAISAASSSESVWVMLGLSGLGYWKGVAAFWAALGCLAGFVFNAFFVTVQLRRASGRLGSVTISDYLEQRLGDKSGMLRFASAIIITFFMLLYVVAQFNGAGDLFQGMQLLGPETPYWLGVVVGAVIIALYIVFGGYAAVCWTDTVQGLLMFVVMCGLPALAFVHAGGISGIADALGPLGLLSISGAEGFGWTAMGFIVGQFGIAIGYPGMPHMIVRYMTVANEKEAARAAWISIIWSAVVLFGSTLLGIAVRAIDPGLAETQKQAEQLVIPYFCRLALPPLATGIVISAVTAAIMSTADSQLMYAATSLTNDLWLRFDRWVLFLKSWSLTGRDREQTAIEIGFWGPLRLLVLLLLLLLSLVVIPALLVDKLWQRFWPIDSLNEEERTARKLILITRGLLLVMTLVAMVVALAEIRLIYTLVLFAWGALGAAFTPIILLSLYWKKLTRWGALASFIVGPLVIVVWNQIPPLKNAVYELIPGFALSLLAAVLVSLWTAKDVPEERTQSAARSE